MSIDGNNTWKSFLFCLLIIVFYITSCDGETLLPEERSLLAARDKRSKNLTRRLDTHYLQDVSRTEMKPAMNVRNSTSS